MSEEEQLKDWAESQLWGPQKNVDLVMKYFLESFKNSKEIKEITEAILAASNKQHTNEEMGKRA